MFPLQFCCQDQCKRDSLGSSPSVPNFSRDTKFILDTANKIFTNAVSKESRLSDLYLKKFKVANFRPDVSDYVFTLKSEEDVYCDCAQPFLVVGKGGTIMHALARMSHHFYEDDSHHDSSLSEREKKVIDDLPEDFVKMLKRKIELSFTDSEAKKFDSCLKAIEMEKKFTVEELIERHKEARLFNTFVQSFAENQDPTRAQWHQTTEPVSSEKIQEDEPLLSSTESQALKKKIANCLRFLFVKNKRTNLIIKVALNILSMGIYNEEGALNNLTLLGLNDRLIGSRANEDVYSKCQAKYLVLAKGGTFKHALVGISCYLLETGQLNAQEMRRIEKNILDFNQMLELKKNLTFLNSDISSIQKFINAKPKNNSQSFEFTFFQEKMKQLVAKKQPQQTTPTLPFNQNFDCPASLQDKTLEFFPEEIYSQQLNKQQTLSTKKPEVDSMEVDVSDSKKPEKRKREWETSEEERKHSKKQKSTTQAPPEKKS